MTTATPYFPERTSTLPPGPRTRLGTTLRWLRSPYGALDALRQQWGDRFTVPAMPPKASRAAATVPPCRSSARPAHTAEMSQSKRLLIL